ncbi:MAG: VIT domain-containing protein [Limisphaerales bacterium]
MRVVNVFLLLLFSMSAFGSGIVIVHDDHRWPGPDRRIIHPPRPRPPAVVTRAIELERQRVTARIEDQVARTTIEQVFHNPNSRQVEGTFLFPVPKGAQLDGFTLEINGQRAEAEMLDSGKARKIYEGIVRSLKDPGLLEYADRDLYKIRIFPFPARGRRTISVSYTQVLTADSGLIEYRAPLSVAKHSGKPPKEVSLEVDLQTKAPLKSVWSATHEPKIEQKARTARITWSAENVKPESDFQLYYAAANTDFGASLLTHRKDGEEGYFLLLLSPGNQAKKDETLPKDVTFVLDTSGSMSGNKLEQAKKALGFCVENLNDQDRFEVLRFATEVEPLFDGLKEADEKNRRRAKEFIRDLRPIGSTAINDALQLALKTRPQKSKRPYVVIFLTDGRPTIGVTNERDIVANVAKDNSRLTRIFCFGIGTDVNTHLLDRITEQTKAFSQYVLPEEDLEVKLSRFFSKIKDPVLADLKLKFPGKVRAAQTYPRNLPDLFKGYQLVVVGRYRNQGKGELVLQGALKGKTVAHEFSFNFPKRSARNSFIPRLWATRRVGYLLDEMRLRGERKELKDEITQLAREYGIVTPYTAYLIVEDERRNQVTMNRRLLPQLENDAVARRELSTLYRSFGRAKSGDAAVASSQVTRSLKTAKTSLGAQQEAVARGGRALRAKQPSLNAPTPVAAPAPRVMTAPNRTLAPVVRKPQLSAPPKKAVMRSRAVSVDERVSTYSAQNRRVAGKTFYRNGEHWLDAEIRTLKQPQPIRVKFGSDAYFQLLRQDPAIARWLALGNQVSFVWKGKLYEVHDSQ